MLTITQSVGRGFCFGEIKYKSKKSGKGRGDDRKQDGTSANETSKVHGLRAGEETDRAMWRRKICNHTDKAINQSKNVFHTLKIKYNIFKTI